jgi:hypothetical protein
VSAKLIAWARGTNHFGTDDFSRLISLADALEAVEAENKRLREALKQIGAEEKGIAAGRIARAVLGTAARPERA